MLALNAQSRAIAALALGFAFVTGTLNRVGTIVAGILADLTGGISGRTEVGVLDVVMILVGIAIFLFAGSVRGDEGWIPGIAQAGGVLAAVGVLMNIAALIAVLAGNNGAVLSLGGLSFAG